MLCTHQPTSQRKSSWPTAVGWCVAVWATLCGLDSNVELAVGINPQLALDKEVSSNTLAL